MTNSSSSPAQNLSLVMTRRDNGSQRHFTAPVPGHRLFAALLSELYDGDSPITVLSWEAAAPGSVTGPWIIHSVGDSGAPVIYDVAVARELLIDPRGLKPTEVLRGRMLELGYEPEADPIDLSHAFYASFLAMAEEFELECAADSQFVLSPTYRVIGPWAPDVWPWSREDFDPEGFDIHLEWEYSQPAWAPDAQGAIIEHVRDVVSPLAADRPVKVVLGRQYVDDSDDLALLRAAGASFEEAGLVVDRFDLEDEIDPEVVLVVSRRIIAVLGADLEGEDDEDSDPDEDDGIEFSWDDHELDPASGQVIWVPLDDTEIEELIEHFDRETSPEDTLESALGRRTFELED